MKKQEVEVKAGEPVNAGCPEGSGLTMNTAKCPNKKHYDDSERVFYVYEWFRKSDGHVFYVGKGKGDRARQKAKTKRNTYFYRYVNKYDCDYRIIKDSLTEHEAYVLEDEQCKMRKANGGAECNISDTSCQNGGSGLPGKLNGMWGKTHTPEVRAYLSLVNKDGHNAGENNAQYGISPKDRMDESTYAGWREKQKKRKFGSTNPKAHIVIAFNPETGWHMEFDTILDCAQWLIDNIERLSGKTKETVRGWVKDNAKNCNITQDGIGFITLHKRNKSDIGNIVPRLSEVEVYQGIKAKHFRLQGVTTTEKLRKGEPSRVGNGRNSHSRSASHPQKDEEIV